MKTEERSIFHNNFFFKNESSILQNRVLFKNSTLETVKSSVPEIIFLQYPDPVGILIVTMFLYQKFNESIKMKKLHIFLIFNDWYWTSCFSNDHKNVQYYFGLPDPDT